MKVRDVIKQIEADGGISPERAGATAMTESTTDAPIGDFAHRHIGPAEKKRLCRLRPEKVRVSHEPGRKTDEEGRIFLGSQYL